MSMKNMLFAAVFFCGSALSPQGQDQFFGQSKFFCSVKKLNELELEKAVQFVQGMQMQGNESFILTEQDAQNAMIEWQKLELRLEKYLVLLEHIAEVSDGFIDVDADSKELKNAVQELLKRAQQDPEITNLVKNLVAFGCKYFTEIVETVADLSVACDEEEIFNLFAEYLPKNIDVVQILMDQIVSCNQYEIKQLQSKKSLTIDDYCHCWRQFGVALKLPKKSLDGWNNLIIAIQKGVKDLPQDLRNEFSAFHYMMRSSDFEQGTKLLSSVAKMRKEVVATKGADQAKLTAYAKLLDQYIAHEQKAYNKNMTSASQFFTLTKSVMIAERLIFKQ